MEHALVRLTPPVVLTFRMMWVTGRTTSMRIYVPLSLAKLCTHLECCGRFTCLLGYRNRFSDNTASQILVNRCRGLARCHDGNAFSFLLGPNDVFLRDHTF